MEASAGSQSRARRLAVSSRLSPAQFVGAVLQQIARPCAATSICSSRYSPLARGVGPPRLTKPPALDILRTVGYTRLADGPDHGRSRKEFLPCQAKSRTPRRGR